MVTKSHFFQELGEYLRGKRLSAGLSQWEVSRKLGYSSAQFVSNCERGLCSLPLAKLRILVDLYKLSPQELTKILLEQQKRLIEGALLKPSRRRRAS